MYEATSRYVDHTLVKNYIKENYPVKYDNNTRLAMTDAMNFHLVVEVTEESSEKEINRIKGLFDPKTAYFDNISEKNIKNE